MVCCRGGEIMWRERDKLIVLSLFSDDSPPLQYFIFIEIEDKDGGSLLYACTVFFMR